MKTHHWQQKGNLYLWRYEPENRNYPGWHTTGDSDGLKSLAELILDLKLDRIEQYRTINLSEPNAAQYDIPGCRSKPVPANKMRVLYSLHDSSQPEVLEQDRVVTLCVSESNVGQYHNALNELLRGNNDFLIGSHDSGLWFW